MVMLEERALMKHRKKEMQIRKNEDSLRARPHVAIYRLTGRKKETQGGIGVKG